MTWFSLFFGTSGFLSQHWGSGVFFCLRDRVAVSDRDGGEVMIEYEMRKSDGNVYRYVGKPGEYVRVQTRLNGDAGWHSRSNAPEGEVLETGGFMVCTEKGAFIAVYECEGDFYPGFAKWFRGEFISRKEV